MATNINSAFRKPPFRIEEKGWGEFEFEITAEDASGKTHTFLHDLNFASENYEIKHTITFKNPKPPLIGILRNSGPIPGEGAGDANGTKKRSSGVGEKKKKPETAKGIDMDKLADGLQKLNEDDLLQVVQMVHDNKSEDSWTRNDIERKCLPLDLQLGQSKPCHRFEDLYLPRSFSQCTKNYWHPDIFPAV